MLGLLKQFWVSEDGATVIEYAILASIVSIAAIATLFLIGGQLSGIFQGFLDLFGDAKNAG